MLCSRGHGEAAGTSGARGSFKAGWFRLPDRGILTDETDLGLCKLDPAPPLQLRDTRIISLMSHTHLDSKTLSSARGHAEQLHSGFV